MPAVVPVTPQVSRANVDWTLARMAERVGNEYVYGGQFDAVDINVGCDCSALVAFICNGVLYGNRATFRRVDGATGAWITTESWRPVEVGERGPFGSICVASPADIPADAAVKIALHHGPGGGAASHTWCEVDGHRFESNGSRGCVTDPDALPIDSSYANDWAYIPGPIDAPANGRHSALVLLSLGNTGDSVNALQAGLRRCFPAYAGDLETTGTYSPRTADAVAEFQRRTLLPVTGAVDETTAAELGRYGVRLTDPAPIPAPIPPAPEPAPAPESSATVITYQPAPAAPEPELQAAAPAPAPARPEHHELLDTIVGALARLAQLIEQPR